MATEIKAFKSNNGKIFETEIDAQVDDVLEETTKLIKTLDFEINSVIETDLSKTQLSILIKIGINAEFLLSNKK